MGNGDAIRETVEYVSTPGPWAGQGKVIPSKEPGEAEAVRTGSLPISARARGS